MDDIDYIKILELSDNPTELDIKQSYRRLAKKYHPDLFNTKPEEERIEAQEKMKEIISAYRYAMKSIKNKQSKFGSINYATLQKIQELMEEIERLLQEIRKMNEEKEAKRKKKNIFYRLFY